VGRALSLRAGSRVSGGGLAEARLALAEFLLGCDDVGECAQRALDWLGAHTEARHAVCLLADQDRTHLVAMAGYGLPASRLAKLAIDLEQREHPLVAALTRGEPVELTLNGSSGRTRVMRLFGRGAFLAIPLMDGRKSEDAYGLLFVNPMAPDIAREGAWLADILGPKLSRLGATRALEAARAGLERERILLEIIINAGHDPVLLTDPEGRMILANARAEALFASTERESEGRRRAIALNNMLFSAALAGRAIDRAEPARRELLLVDPTDGSDLLFELLSTVVTDASEESRVVSVLRNVTDLRTAIEAQEENYRKLRAAEANVRAERDRLELVIDAVADPILVTDPAGAIVMMNAPAERLFTVQPDTPGEVDVRVQSNDAHFSSFVSNLLLAGDTLRHSGPIGLTDPETGESLPVEALAGKVLSAQGELVGVVTILHDQREALEKQRLYEQLQRASQELGEKVRQATAELVRQNELLRRQAIQLEHASALKSRFLANMSHEFRTPLNAILGYTSMLLQGVLGELTSQQRRSLERVDSSGRHLLALISDILDISRIEAGKMPVHVSDVPLPELLAEVMAEVEPIVSRTSLSVTEELAPNLPVIESDRPKVKQIVLNLLANALKFTPEGWVKVSATFDDASDRILVAVADSGIGIADEDQAKIFEDFSQADSSPSRAYSGAGLGLSISRRLASMLGGQVTLQSKLGQGSTFTLILPRTRTNP
jgi:signal transduction histidine kinase